MLLIAASMIGGVTLVGCGSAASSGGASCGTFNAAALNNRPVPQALDPATVVPPPSQRAVNNTAASMGAPEPIPPTEWTQVQITPAQAKAVCEKHLTGVFLDWSNVPYNLAIRSGVRTVWNALGVKVLRITDSEFSPTGLAGDLNSVLPLNPDLIVFGGTINPSQMASIMAPAVAQHKIIVSWGDGGPGMHIGSGKQLASLIAYDWYYLGQQMATAVHQAYPDGATLGYIHWINDVDAILLREQGFLDGLKNYPNIHVVAQGGPPNPSASNSGFTDPNAAEAYTEAFLQAHPDVNVLFAPWEDPPGLGEAAAINALHLGGKVHVVTMDLGSAGAKSLATHGMITVDMAQDIYDGGRMMAMTAALASIGVKVPGLVNVPTFVATSSNVGTAWSFMHGPEVPCNCGA